MNYNSIPLIVKGTFIRKEREGAILIPVSGDINDSLIINETGFSILSLCNSKNSINNIVEQLKVKYNDENSIEILQDVVEFINLMKKRNIIFCDLKDEISIGKDIYSNENLSVYRCGEQKIGTIKKILNNKEIKNYIYDELKINTLYIKNNINKFYIIIDKKNNNLGLLFFKNSSNKFSVIYDIMICKSNVDIININNVINICINDLINLSNGNLNKIRISINSDENFHFIEEILKNGFKKSVILSHEYGLNLHKIIFERIL